MERYDLEYLHDKFMKHSEEYMASPHYNSDDFNLPCALGTLVMEIMQLRDEIDRLKGNV